MAFCTNCGHEVFSAFCGSCGAPTGAAQRDYPGDAARPSAPLAGSDTATPTVAPRSSITRRAWIAIAAAAVLLAGGITAVVALTGGNSSADRSNLVVDYPNAPTESFTVRLDDLLDVDPDAPSPGDMSVVAASRSRVIIAATAQTVSGSSGPDASGGDPGYRSVVASLGAPGNVLWQVDSDTLWGGGTPNPYLNCVPRGRDILCATTSRASGTFTTLTTIDPDTGKATSTQMDGRSGAGDFPSIQLIGSDILRYQSHGLQGTSVSRYNLTTKKALWTFDYLPQGDDGGVPVSVVGDHMVVHQQFGENAYETDVLDADSGHLLQRFDDDVLTSDGTTWYDVRNNASGSSDGNGNGITALSPSGAALWTYPTGRLMSPAATPNARVLVADHSDSSRTTVSALDAKSGRPVWSSMQGASSDLAARFGTALLFSTSPGMLLLDGGTGKSIGRAAGDFVAAGAASFYTYEQTSSTLFAYSGSTGKRLWNTSIAALTSGIGSPVWVHGQAGYLTINAPNSVTILLPD